MPLFQSIDEAPRDPILGMTELFNADPRHDKINLSVGVYFDNEGKIPRLGSVKNAEQILFAEQKSHPYLPIQGADAYCRAVQNLIFGSQSELSKAGRIVTIQALGGTGGLKIGADFIKRFFPSTQVAISDPSWENHRLLFEYAGYPVTTYPYYDAKTRDLDFHGMLSALDSLSAQSIVVLHACCHNPTGIDLTRSQWIQVIDVCRRRNHIPFLDMAYQGFAEGVEKDAEVVRLFAESGLSVLVSNSFSKSFSLYGERIGALSIVTDNQHESMRVLSQVKRIIRTNYSNPPTLGSSIVSMILNHPEQRALWEQELGEMRMRIQCMRNELVLKLEQQGADFDFSVIQSQRGMFSYSGLSSEHAHRLQQEYGIYILPTGRICIAALNTHNIDRVVHAITNVIGETRT
jgi:aromatic-amino-acid transaminase